MEKILFSEAEGREALGGLGRSKFYELIRDGEIQIVKIGRRTFVARDELERYVASLSKAVEVAK